VDQVQDGPLTASQIQQSVHQLLGPSVVVHRAEGSAGVDQCADMPGIVPHGAIKTGQGAKQVLFHPLCAGGLQFRQIVENGGGRPDFAPFRSFTFVCQGKDSPGLANGGMRLR